MNQFDSYYYDELINFFYVSMCMPNNPEFCSDNSASNVKFFIKYEGIDNDTF